MDEDPNVTLQALNTEDKVIILSCDMLLEGYHVDTVDGVLLFRNVQSLTVFQQILGRVSSIGSNMSPLIVDCTESAYKLLTKLLNQDKSRSPRDKYERSDFPNQEHAILNVSLEYAQAYDIMFLLKNHCQRYCLCRQEKLLCRVGFKVQRSLCKNEKSASIVRGRCEQCYVG